MSDSPTSATYRVSYVIPADRAAALAESSGACSRLALPTGCASRVPAAG
jgi:hypothetical protein